MLSKHKQTTKKVLSQSPFEEIPLRLWQYLIKKAEIKIGMRSMGNLEIIEGLNKGDKIIAEGLTKVRPGMKVKPITKSQ